MKKLLLIAALCGAVQSFAQNNVILDTGYVGIGTTNPSARLQVSGSARIDSTLNVSDSMIIEGGTVMKSDASVRQDLTVDGNAIINGQLKLPQVETAESYKGVLTVDENGIVKSLHWYDLLPTAEPNPPTFACPDGNNGYTTPMNGAWISGLGKLVTSLGCDPDPLVGIGITEPTARLHISLVNPLYKTTRPFAIENYQHSTFFQINRFGELWMRAEPGSVKPIITVYNDADYRVLQLEKSGLLRSREIKVDLDSWADFVFEPGYQLKPLSEVEQYIAQNGHLPDVPAADEMCSEGLNVAETDAMLMQKIEELTLYLIQLQKQVEAQQKLIEAQQKQLDAATAPTIQSGN